MNFFSRPAFSTSLVEGDAPSFRSSSLRVCCVDFAVCLSDFNLDLNFNFSVSGDCSIQSFRRSVAFLPRSRLRFSFSELINRSNMPISSSAFKRTTATMGTSTSSASSSSPRPVGELQLLDDKTGQVISSRYHTDP